MKKNKKQIIYKATNKVNNKCYIGATIQDIESRKKDHINKANKRMGGCFQEALATYGTESFDWEQIDTASNQNELAEKERKYILKYESINNGYNQNKGGGFRKFVYQCDVNTGQLLNSFEDLESAAKHVKGNKKSISKACLNDRRTSKNYFWSYTLTNDFSSKIDTRKRQIEQCKLDGSLVSTYNSIQEASIVTKINKSSIAKCCRGERNKAGGFIWRTKN
ncbi:NUMOD1 domain-containing DNA-binding protein [Flavobacterium sp.]|uniref:NUMOD1 domain-containing DNA-binding protein n=1 Tax=Flavobacterium sp. TaxID=239 RepID=UPI003D29F494